MFEGPDTNLLAYLMDMSKDLKKEARKRSWYWLPFTISYFGQTFRYVLNRNALRYHWYRNARQVILYAFIQGGGIQAALLMVPHLKLPLVVAGVLVLTIILGWAFTRWNPLKEYYSLKILTTFFVPVMFLSGNAIGFTIALLLWQVSITVAMITVAILYLLMFAWGFFGLRYMFKN